MGEGIIGDVIIETMDGRKIKLENSIVNCITENRGFRVPEYDYLEYFREPRSYELELVSKKISRKRYIKLLMARGLQRNEAVGIANYIHREYGEYNSMRLYFI